MSAISLKEILRKRVLDDMIRAIEPAGKWKLLVVDSNSAKLLNSICKSHEILQENVTVIEDMSQKRQAYSTFEAIYFVSPQENTIDKIIADFKAEPPMYLAAHLFFISCIPDINQALEDNLFAKLKGSGTTKHIKSLREMNVDLIALENQIFSFDMPLSPFPLFNPKSPNDTSAELNIIAKKMMSLLFTLGDAPYIRYYSKEPKGIACQLAMRLKQEITLAQKNDSSYPAQNDFKKAILIIIDRKFDMIAPLLHEFTYQAMVNDLVCGDKSKSSDPNATVFSPSYFVPSPVYSSLDENDSIWVLIRHWHFAEAVDFILESFNKFMHENKAASAINGPHLGGLDAIKSMKDTLSALPQFQSLKAKFAVHINAAQECKLHFERRYLDMVASVQQDLATGETANGKNLKSAMLDLIPILDNRYIPITDKLRTLIIYIIAMNGVQDIERQKLLQASKLSPSESQSINNLALMGVNLTASATKKEKGRYTYWGSYKVERKKRKKGKDDLPYDLSRYVPLVKRLLEDQISNCVPKEIFEWVEEPVVEDATVSSMALKMFRLKPDGIVPPDPKYPYSLRTTRASWTGQTRQKLGEIVVPKEARDLRRNGPRIILFSLGGLTYSEMRSAYELTKETQREIIMGSTFIYNPPQFVDLLCELHRTDISIETMREASAAVKITSPTTASSPVKEKDDNQKRGIFSKKPK